MLRHIRARCAVTLSWAALLLGGCTVGPNYAGPPSVVPSSHAFARAQTPTVAAPIKPSRWWTALNDPVLNRLEELALAHNPDLDAARARLRSSRADLQSKEANLLPSTATSFNYLHSHTGPGLLAGFLGDRASGQDLGNSDVDLFNLGFDATWEADLFGGKRRAAESASANAGARLASFADAQVSLTAEIARRYVSLREMQARHAIAVQVAADDARICTLEEQRFRKGTVSEVDVENLRQSALRARADLGPLETQRDEQLDRLAILTGTLPGELDAELLVSTSVPLPPAHVDTPAPAVIVRKRPDIRVAERQLAAANARIGQHVADYFPKLQLIGDLGFASTDISQLLNGNAFLAVVAPMLSWKPFDFGRTAAAVAGARADYDKAISDYQSTVLAALADVEDALSRYGHQQNTVRERLSALGAAQHGAELARLRYYGGTIGLLAELDARNRAANARQQERIAVADLTRDYIALQKAFGFGW